MLWAPIVGEEVVVDEAVPHGLHGTNARSEELAEVPCLSIRCPDDTGHPILDVPCRRVPVDVVDIVVVVVDIVVIGGGVRWGGRRMSLRGGEV